MEWLVETVIEDRTFLRPEVVAWTSIVLTQDGLAAALNLLQAKWEETIALHLRQRSHAILELRIRIVPSMPLRLSE